MMTPEQIEFHRKRFEEYWQKEVIDKLHPMFNLNSIKLKDEKRSQWEGWIKSIESIEIPIRKGIGIYNNRYILNKEDVEHLKSLGLKVKER